MKNQSFFPRWLWVFAFVIWTQSAFGLSYLWSKGTTSYTPIVGTSLTFSTADNGYNYFTLPFTFNFDSTNVTYAYISTNGYLTFYGSTVTSITNSDLFTTLYPINVLAPWWDDLIDDDTSTVEWLLTGTTPNRILTIQYSAFPSYVTLPRSRINFQVKLFETSNQIQFVYGDQIEIANSNPSSSASIGIKGKYTSPAGFVEGTTGSTSVGIPNLSTATGFPALNTVFTFAPDTLTPKGLQAVAASGQVSLTWNRTKMNPFLRYRVYVGTSASTLILRDSTAGLNDTTLTVPGLTNGTLYYFAVKAVSPSGYESNFSNIVSATPTQPPTISITNPTSGSVVQTSSALLLTSIASDPDGSIARVEYYLGSTYLGASTVGSAWQYNWYPASVGTFSLTAKAIDNAGAATISTPVNVRVSAPPSVSLTSPTASIYPTGTTLTLTASATQSAGASITKVEFFDGATKIGEALTSPYTLNWSGGIPGRHTLTAVATNSDGFTTTSAIRSIGIGTLPTVTVTSPMNGTSVSYPSTVILTATLNDPDSLVGRVAFYGNGSILANAYWPGPYTISWTPTFQGNHQVIARLYDYLGLERDADTSTFSLWQGPQVKLTSPSYFSAYFTGASIPLSATATPVTGSISEVRFYHDSVLIGTDASAPYDLTWSNAPAGRYRIQAQATDNSGRIGFSQALTIFVNDSGITLPGGRLVITGHDPDDHQNYEFISVCLDYLFFGRIPTAGELSISKGGRIAFVGTRDLIAPTLRNYPTPTYINPLLPKWDSLLFENGHYDAIIVGTGLDYLTKIGSDSLNTKRARFDEYFNQGGNIFAFSEQGLGQPYYNFLPAFGSAKQQSIGSVSGVFTVTTAGAAIGLTSGLVNIDLTHTEFLDVDSLFQTFEYYNVDGMPVTIGASAVIDAGGFIPIDSVVGTPIAIARDSIFDDTLCIRFSTPTLDATLHLTTDGGNPDTSTWTLTNGSMVCIDRSTTIRVIAKKPGWVTSRDASFSYRKLGQVITPLPDITDLYFKDSICVAFTSATVGAELRYTLDGSIPDSNSASKLNGAAICLLQTDTIQIIGVKSGMIPSNVGTYTYLKMDTVATPTLNLPDTVYFSDSLCVTFKDSTAGAHILYTIDGGSPDTSEKHAHDGDRQCFDQTTPIRLIGTKLNWVPSDQITYQFILQPDVAPPIPNRIDSIYFADTLCVSYSSATDSSVIHYVFDGGALDTSTLEIPNHGGFCVDRTIDIKAQATRIHWDPSPVTQIHFFKMDTAGIVTATPGDSTNFKPDLCVTLSSSTANTSLSGTVTWENGSISNFNKANGDTVCLDKSAQLQVHATKPNWVNSPTSTFRYFLKQQVSAPKASRQDSVYFTDTLCVRFTSANDSTTIHYVLNGGNPYASPLSMPNGQGFCVDSTVDIKAIAKRPNWDSSEITRIRFFKMDTVAMVIANPGDSTYFTRSLCIALNSLTPEIKIEGKLTPYKGISRSFTKTNNDTVCVEDSVTLEVQGMKANWVSSPKSTYHYFPRQKAAIPVADQKDSIYFVDSLCYRFTSPSKGVRIFYSLDGSSIDSNSAFLENGGQLCTDTSLQLHVIAGGPEWLPSDTLHRVAFRMSELEPPQSIPGDSTYFKDSLCIRWTHATSGTEIRLAIDSQKLDSTAKKLKSGDSVCIDKSTEFHARADKLHWISSPIANRHFFRMEELDLPEFDRGDTVFFPNICIELRHSNDSAELHYTVNGGKPDTSSLIKYSGDTICVNRTADIKVVAKQKNAIDSKTASIHLEKMKQVAEIQSSRGDSLDFAGKLCFTLTSKTDSSRIAYTLDGSDPSATSKTVASGDSVCVTKTVEIKAVGLKQKWLNSDTARFVYIVDNDGPDIVHAEKRPYQIGSLSITGNCRGIGQDTLILTLSEKLKARSRPPRWEKLALFSPRCDLGSTYPVPVMINPILSKDSLKITYLFDNSSVADIPQAGHCIYLDAKSKEFTDAVGNLPDSVGAKIEESSKTVRISRLRAYPPVVGLDETPDSKGCVDEKADINSWIQPFGFDPATGTVSSKEVQSCNESQFEGDIGYSKIPKCLSVLEVISNGGYEANVQIFDQFGVFVNSSRQYFGHCGELENLNRSEKGKSRSYLVWNSRDRNGTRVGTGAYLWRIEFKSDFSKPGQTRTIVLRTGFIRTEDCKD